MYGHQVILRMFGGKVATWCIAFMGNSKSHMKEKPISVGASVIQVYVPTNIFPVYSYFEEPKSAQY